MSESGGEKRQKPLDAGLWSLDTPFWQNHGQQNHFWNHEGHQFSRIGGEALGYSSASQAGAVLSNPFVSELARDSEIPSLIILNSAVGIGNPWFKNALFAARMSS